MSFDINKYIKNDENSEIYQYQENFINIWTAICAFFNNIIYEFILGLLAIGFIFTKNIWCALILILIYIFASNFINIVYTVMKNFIINLIPIPVNFISKKIILVIHFIIDSFVCWFASMFFAGVLFGCIGENSTLLFYAVIIISTIITKNIFLLETGNKNIIAEANKNIELNRFLNYNIIFANSLFLSSLTTCLSMLFNIQKNISIILFLCVLLVPSLFFIIFEMNRNSLEEME